MSLSFQNPNNKLQGQALKDAFVQIIKEDKARERLVKGRYWAESIQRGCAVGCSEHALCTILGHKFTDTRHEYLSGVLDIPEAIFHLQDRIFGNLPTDKADQFAVDFVEALPIGKDLTNVEYKIKIWILEKTKKYANEETITVIDNIIGLHERKIAGEDVDYSSALSAARAAAELAARSAALSAARSAARSAEESAALSAALSAVWSAAELAAESSALSAAWSAARSAEESAALSAALSAEESSAESVFWGELSQFLIQHLKETK